MKKFDKAIDVEGVCKYYNLYKDPKDRLKQKFFRHKKYYKEFKALEDISFSVNRGETFGIIGVNGSGKSTLLQILAGIIPHNKGTVNVNGKVAALLELGSGFDPEFTGRENIYVNSSIFGLEENQIVDRMEEIIKFADIGKFVDQPVKIYSSGMFVRLAFAITTSVDADILLVDEALAVGDIFFRQKCYDRLNKLKESGTSIVLVSHAMNEVEQFCDRALLLANGRAEFYGDAKSAVRKYYLLEQKTHMDIVEKANDSNKFSASPKIPQNQVVDWVKPGNDVPFSEDNITKNGDAQLLRVILTDENNLPTRVFYQGQVAVFHSEYIINNDIEVPAVGVCIVNEKNIIVHGKNTYQMDTKVPNKVNKGTIIRFSQSVKLDIAEGEYTFQLGFNQVDIDTYNSRKYIEHIEFDKRITFISDAINLGPFTVFKEKGNGFTHLNHFGIADLQGSCVCVVGDE